MTMTDRTVLTEDTRWPLKLAGFIAIALGVLALFAPFVAGLVVTLVLGANFLISGILKLSPRSRPSGGRGPSALCCSR